MLTERGMQRFGSALTWFLLGALAGWAVPCKGQDSAKVVHVIPVLIVDQHVRDTLAKLWNETDATQPERGYCVAWHGGIFPDKVLAIQLDRLVKPDTILGANGYSVSFHCPPRTVKLHTHTPVTCEGGAPVRGQAPPVCAIGGIDAYQCFGSPGDILGLEAQGMPFGIVQCSREAFVMFFPRPPDRR